MADPKIAQKSPYVLDMQSGKYVWYTGGLSDKQPFYDGSHNETDLKPIIDELGGTSKVACCGWKILGKKTTWDSSYNKL